ncbi:MULTISPECIES: hypothetical protein [unclassified Sulfurospirillum]|uniref:hypothetical protein n=1 Tax=unclassified Sulfurospirillum TaxID=2618290 RepID=UPI000500C63F|nr:MULTISPECIES: hypothetical protein [unclassified Sulfurospirillum]KFL34072.1 hypothetical protein JU57_08145 [Sulfurospirillum sp. SCADC]
MLKILKKFFEKLFKKTKPKQTEEEVQKNTKSCRWCHKEINGPTQKKYCNESCKKKHYYFLKKIELEKAKREALAFK